MTGATRPRMTSVLVAEIRDDRIKPGYVLLDEGRALARDWRLGNCLFMTHHGVSSEAEYKRVAMAEGRITQHAHIGFRSVDRTLEAIREVYDSLQRTGAQVDRFGITLDWSMGYPPDQRVNAQRGTGIVLTSPEDFARITNASPAASHFGDFMLGLPGSVANVCGAIAAGATSIGNLGQYFTFRMPYWDDDVATTEATVTALGLIAAQSGEILVHSNLDDGYAGLFLDMACALGMVMVEKYIVEDLIGAPLAFCYGHHFSDPLTRAGFHAALARISETPGTMIFGNTVSYQRSSAGNYASLSSYLLADMIALLRKNTGHAVNPVPVTENQRIPDIDEIIDAQLFASRLKTHAPFYGAVIDKESLDKVADKLLAGGKQFFAAVMTLLTEAGIDTNDPAAMLLAIKRLGAKRLEALCGPGIMTAGKLRPLIPAEWARELDHIAEDWANRARKSTPGVNTRTLKVVIATTDVHEHGKYLVERALRELGVEIVDGGVSVDAEVLVDIAQRESVDAIAVSTYNGVALSYTQALLMELERRELELPVMIGGKLNGVPKDSNSGLPVDVTSDIRALGAFPCLGLDDILPVLDRCPNAAPG